MSLAIALADESLIVREGVSQILADDHDLEVVAACGDLPSLIEAIDRVCPDVVVTDVRMLPTDPDDGVGWASLLRHRHRAMGIVGLSDHPESTFALALLESGPRGRAYVLKERVHDAAQLAAAIDVVAAGGCMVDPKIVEHLAASTSMLSAREREILLEVAVGKGDGAIAENLGLTGSAVRERVNSTFAKLDLADVEDVSDRMRAALRFLAGLERNEAARRR
jgi:DNA-binding NarL/FixJ family response regulator